MVMEGFLPYHQIRQYLMDFFTYIGFEGSYDITDRYFAPIQNNNRMDMIWHNDHLIYTNTRKMLFQSNKSLLHNFTADIQLFCRAKNTCLLIGTYRYKIIIGRSIIMVL